MLLDTILRPAEDPHYPEGVLRLDYRSSEDNSTDWALILPGKPNGICLVNLHGHGSQGNQLFTRDDLKESWPGLFYKHGLTVLCPNLRDNAWMCPEAVSDLHALLDWMRDQYSTHHFIFWSGSMGGTGNLIYSIRHPKDISIMVALCPVTDIGQYQQWCMENADPAIQAIGQAIAGSYQGAPHDQQEKYSDHSVLDHCDRLIFPLFLAHGTADAAIPVSHSRDLKEKLNHKKNLKYIEIPDGDHDTPLHAVQEGLFAWFEGQLAAINKPEIINSKVNI